MEAIAKLKNVPTSPRKMRYVVDLIRNKPVAAALSTLQYMDQSGSYFVDKLLRSAIANWQAKNPELNLEDANLHITKVFVDGPHAFVAVNTNVLFPGTKVRALVSCELK